MKLTIATALVGLSFAVPVFAQRIEPPNKGDARSPAERATYDKAMCVHRGLTEAGKVFTPAQTSAHESVAR